jgi:hypothetical protein
MQDHEEQGRFSNIREGRIFPYNGRSVGTAFRRECGKLRIKDLHFHDLRRTNLVFAFSGRTPALQASPQSGRVPRLLIKEFEGLLRYGDVLHRRAGADPHATDDLATDLHR